MNNRFKFENLARVMRALLSFLCVCFSAALFGQTGNYFVSHYAPTEGRFDYVCFDMAQDKKGVMYFATKAGILEFNGRDWDLLEGLSSVYSIEINNAGEIYWAGAKGFGRIGLDEHGFQKIEVLSDSTVKDVFQSIVTKDHAYFLTDDILYVLDPATHQVSSIKTGAPQNTYLRLFELFGVAYANTTDGIFKVERTKLVPSRLILSDEVIFYSRIDNNYVIGTADNKVYTCTQDLELKAVALQDSTYIDASVIVAGSWINRQLLALGTLRGGVIFVNPINGITQGYSNYSTGLPDNEVYHLMSDVNGNTWVAHDYGFTKIAPFMPLRSFSHYQGVEGNLLCSFSAENSVYVGTSLGLFRLEKEDVYDEMVYYVDVEIKQPKKTAGNKPAVKPSHVPSPSTTKSDEETKPKVRTRKGGLFSFLRRKNNSEEEVQAAPKEQQQLSDEAEASLPPEVFAPQYRKEKKTERVLRSSSYVFKKVKGIDAKITDIAEVKGRLIASGLGGLYEIQGLGSKQIIGEPIRHIFAPRDRDILIVSTYEDDVRTLRFTEKAIENVSLFTKLNDQIHYIFEGDNNEVWLCGIDQIYRAQLSGSEVSHKQTIPLNQQNVGRTVGVVKNGHVILANTLGFFHLDRKNKVIQKIDSLPAPTRCFAHNGNIIYRDEHGWNFFGNQKIDNSLQLLNVFNDLRFIASDKNPENLWLVSGGNELYKFYGDKVTPYGSEFPIFLKSIVHQDRKLIKLEEIIMDQEHSSVRFEVVQPDYINPTGVEFRHLLAGMDESWTAWSNKDNVIEFPYLPTGKYTLHVQAKNMFGNVTELDPLVFEVLPPYWKRPWFYALEFAVFASLVMLSFRLSTRYRIVSRLLSLLTIILLIEFIQTAIGATFSTKNSPVTDFFIQVVVALLVLPVEGYLRNLMLRSLDSSGKFYQFIVPKTPVPRTEKPEKFIEEPLELDE
jgi:hypothetical protein